MQIFFLNRWGHFKDEWQQGLSAPIIDRAEEFANICSPIPSSFTGFLFLLVFGSTQESRAQAKTLFADVRVFITGKKPPPELPTWKSNHRGTIGQFRAEAQTTRRLNKNRASDISSLFNTDRLSPVSTNGNGSVISGNGVDSSTSNIHARLHRGPPRPLTIITLPESSRIRDSPCSLSIAGLGSANTTDQEINFFTFNSRWNLGGTNPPTSAASASPLSLLSSASYSPLLGSGVNSGLDRTSYPTPTMSPSKSIIDSGREREREGAWWNSLAGRGMSPISPLPPARIVLGNEMMRGGYGDIGDSMEGAGNGGRAANGGGENSSNGGGFRGRAGIDTVRKDNRDI